MKDIQSILLPLIHHVILLFLLAPDIKIYNICPDGCLFGGNLETIGKLIVQKKQRKFYNQLIKDVRL